MKLRRDGETVLVKGRIELAGDDRASVTTEDGAVVEFGYDEIAKARTVFRWQAAPKPGKK
jgi:hypothetical protein